MARHSATETNRVPDEAALAVVADHGEDDGAGAMLAQIQGSMALGQVSGEVGMSEVRLARLQITYGVGKLAEKFNPGDLILGGDNLLVHKGEPLNVILLSVTPYWKEYTKFDANGPLPRVFLTEHDVIANGGTVAWNNGVGPSYSRAMHLKLLIEKPKDLICGLFGVQVGERVFAPAVWDVDKSAYRRVGPVILSASQFSLRTDGLLRGVFEIKTGTEVINNNITVVPSIRLSAHNTDDEIRAIRSLFEPRSGETANAQSE